MKQIKYWQLCLALWLGIVSLSCAQNKEIFELAEDEKLIEFTTDRFTLPNLHVTPDGENIIFDVLGDIYQVPIEGGKAEVLLQDNNWKRAGKLSPDGQTLAYVSDETGEFQVWTYNLNSREKRLYPIKEYIHYPLFAYWKDKSNLLIPSKEGLQNYEVTTGEMKIIRPALDEERSILHAINRTMSINKIGEYSFFQKNKELWAHDLNKGIDLFIGAIPDKAFLEFIRGSDTGEKVVFYKKQKEDRGTQDLISWNLTTNNLKFLNTTHTLGSSTSLNYSFDFIDDKTIILDKEGEVVRMDIETGEFEPIPIEVEVKKVIKKPLRREPQYIRDSIITASVLRNPVTQPNLDTIYFGAFGKLHSYAKNTEVITEVYPEADRFEVSPSLSPDGEYLAYTTWNDTEMGHLYVRAINTGKEYQLTQNAGRYINPAWSPDGTEIIFIADETEAKNGIDPAAGIHFKHILSLNKISVCLMNRKNKKSEKIADMVPFSPLAKRYFPTVSIVGNSVFIPNFNSELSLSELQHFNIIDYKLKNSFLIPFHTDEVLVSPNAQHIAFIFDEQVWVDVFPHSLKIKYDDDSEFFPEQYHYKEGHVNNILLPSAKSVYEIAPSYLYWQDEYTLMWGSAKEVYTYDVRTGMTEKIAEIKVQKSRAVPKTQYALTNARIITMNKQDEIIEKGTILIKGNRIQEVGSMEDIKIPENYETFNFEGKTIMPGLIDVHAHYHHFPYEFQVQQNFKYMDNLAYGVTTIYDPSVNVLDYRERAQMVETGQILGPRVFASGNIIMGIPAQYDFKNISTLSDADRLVKSLKKMEVHGPIKEYDIKNRKYRLWLRKAAKDNNMTITAEITSYTSAITHILDGYSAIEHNIATFDVQNDIFAFSESSNINYTPTFIISNLYNLLLNFNVSLNEICTILTLEGEKHISVNRKEECIKIFDKYTEHQVKVLGKRNLKFIDTACQLILNNVLVSIGAHGSYTAGLNTHWELWLLTITGLESYKALKAATINGAEKLDLQEEIGSIEVGKFADLLVLKANPLENILNSLDIELSIINGRKYKVE